MTEKHCRFIIIFEIDNKLKQSQLWLPGLFISSWLLHLVGLPQNTSNSLACSAGIFLGWAKPCSCSWYCFSRHLWFYDSGRLGRVEIVTLTVGARLKVRGRKKERGEGEGRKILFSLSPPLPAPFDSPHLLLSSGSFNMALSRANWALKENARLAILLFFHS